MIFAGLKNPAAKLQFFNIFPGLRLPKDEKECLCSVKTFFPPFLPTSLLQSPDEKIEAGMLLPRITRRLKSVVFSKNEIKFLLIVFF